MDVIVDRCAGLDVHKNTVMAAVRSPDGVGGRAEVVREFSTFTRDLVGLGEGKVLLPPVNTAHQNRVTNRPNRLPLQSTRMRSTVDCWS